MGRHKTTVPVLRICETCAKEFFAKPFEVSNGKARFCSRPCIAKKTFAGIDQRGSANHNWRGGVSFDDKRKVRYKADHPERHAAHRAVSSAVRKGILKKLPCEVCGEEKAQAHHDDYSRQLDVRWLCKTHHLAVHGGSFNCQPVSNPAC